MTERVRPGRVGMIAGALAALPVFVVLMIQPVPDRVVRVFGGSSGFDRAGGVRLRYRPPASLSEQDLAYYLRGRSSIRREGDLLVIELPGVADDAASRVIDMLVSGGLALREVLDDDRYAGDIAHLGPLPDDARIEVDRWGDEGGVVHTVPFLVAPARDSLVEAVRRARATGWSPPSGTEVAFEYQDWGPPPGFWRTHLLRTEVAIDGTLLNNAMGSYDPNTNRPIVLLDFTREGGQLFCDLTRRIAGRKLAILVGREIRSAPIINGAICGGRASISMGGQDPVQQERERDMLVSVLSTGTVPPGGVVETQERIEPARPVVQEWLARALIPLGVGAVVGLLAGLLIWIARPVRRRAPERVDGPFPTRRLVVTLLAPVALYLGSMVTLPGINEEELLHVLSKGWTSHADLDLTRWSVIALGWMPILTAFVVVELVALAVPRLRRRRHDPRGRVGLGKAAAIVGVTIALVQGYFLAVYLEALSRGGAEVVIHSGWTYRIVVMVTLGAGTALLAVVAGMIREHGLGNGYGALFLATAVLYFVRPLLDEPALLLELFDRGSMLGLAVLAGMVIATRAVLRWRISDGERGPELRMPTSGVVPLSDAGGLGTLLGIALAFGLDWKLERVVDWYNRIHADPIAMLGLAVIAVPLYAWLFARPAVVARVAMQAGLSAPTWSAWLRATLLSGALLLGCIAAAWIAVRVLASASMLANAVVALFGTAVVLDMIDDARAHRRKLAPAAVLHQIQYAGVVERVLADAGIPCHIHASNVRTLFAFFGPWAPAIVLVPEAHAADARQKLDDVLRPATAAIPQAQVREAT